MSDTGVGADLARELLDHRNGWSIGILGGLAEFYQRQRARVEQSGGVTTLETASGALRIELSPDVRAHAYEALSARPEAWQHGVAFGLAEDRCDGAARSVVTELGPDAEAIRPRDRRDILFDLGLGTPSCDFLVRTSNPELLALLRGLAGTRVFGDAADTLPSIAALQPHRVVVSPLGRAEIYQRIPQEGESTPDGPHTHLLAGLVKRRRTHAADTSIPADLVPCLSLHPPNPTFDEHGRRRSFDSACFWRFQQLLARHGDAELLRLKHTIWDSVRKGAPPRGVNLSSRTERIVCRVALRQLGHLDGAGETLAAWKDEFDAGAERRSLRPGPVGTEARSGAGEMA